MKTILVFLSIIYLHSTTYADNPNGKMANKYDDPAANSLTAGKISDNILDINVNGMVCDFCAQSIEKVFMKREDVEGIKVNLENQKVIIYLQKNSDIKDETLSEIFEDAGYSIEKINRKS